MIGVSSVLVNISWNLLFYCFLSYYEPCIVFSICKLCLLGVGLAEYMAGAVLVTRRKKAENITLSVGIPHNHSLSPDICVCKASTDETILFFSLLTVASTSTVISDLLNICYCIYYVQYCLG